MRGRPRSLTYGALALAALLTLLAGCTSKKHASTTPHAGGTLDVSIRDLGTLDPAKASGRGAILVVSQIFDSLTKIDATTGLVKPAAASSWTTSADGKTWTFSIAPAKYSNGDPVRARDFKFAFDRIAQKALKSDIAYELQPITGYAAAQVLGKAKSLAGVSAPNDGKLVIKLDRPFYELPYSLADPGFAPIPVRVYGGSTNGLKTTPVGNGPFHVVSATAESQATLARTDDYYGTKAYLDGIKFHVVTTGAGWSAFQGGQTDVTDVPADQVASGKGFDQRGFTPVWATLSFGPNLKLPKYQDLNVRIAMSLAIDRNAIASDVFKSTKDAATGLIPAGVRGYVPGACANCTFNQNRARLLLAAKFRSHPRPSISIDYLGEPTSKSVAQAIAKDLNAVGFHASLRSHTADEYTKLLNKGGQDFAELGWIQNVPSPDGFLAQQLLTGSPNNRIGFQFGRFDADIAAARARKVETARLAAYAGAEKRAFALMPIIPIVFYRNRLAVSSRVNGFALDGAGMFDASAIWLS
ncbi:MAG: ABC transporter substrate-binding protein [Actinobacteria bacterium]|nr:MAG: ABC transporter substrate-binding protein [Actinomycetota bacterium]